MTTEALNWALNVDHPALNPSKRLMLIGIANHDGDGGASPSIDTLARHSCVSRRSAQRTIRALVDDGLVEVFTNQGGTHRTDPGRRPNLYVLARGVG